VRAAGRVMLTLQAAKDTVGGRGPGGSPCAVQNRVQLLAASPPKERMRR
jgi:hypothetical protein